MANKEGMMPSVIEVSPEETEARRDPGRRPLIITLVVLAVALVGLGAWVVYDQSSSSDASATAVTAEFDQLFDDYIEAFNAYDVEAVGALITDGFMLYRPSYDPLVGVSSALENESRASELFIFLEGGYRVYEYQWERLGDAIMSGEGPWVVSQVVRATSTSPTYPGGVEGVSTLTVVDEDGALKVARDVFVAFGSK